MTKFILLSVFILMNFGRLSTKCSNQKLLGTWQGYYTMDTAVWKGYMKKKSIEEQQNIFEMILTIEAVNGCNLSGSYTWPELNTNKSKNFIGEIKDNALRISFPSAYNKHDISEGPYSFIVDRETTSMEGTWGEIDLSKSSGVINLFKVKKESIDYEEERIANNETKILEKNETYSIELLSKSTETLGRKEISRVTIKIADQVKVFKKVSTPWGMDYYFVDEQPSSNLEWNTFVLKYMDQ